jgi:hypothetical protein
MREPYRVGVWGPGTIGKAVIREILLLPETELVSVLAYNPAKDGIDAGTLVGGISNTGVLATTSPETFIAAKPEIVIHAPRDYGDFRADDELVALLEAGINVITVLPYQYPQLRDPGAVKRLEAAAFKGGATLFGTGMNPGFQMERLAMLATGISNGVKRVGVAEYVNCAGMPGAGEFLSQFGFGLREGDTSSTEHVIGVVENCLLQSLHYAAETLEKKIERIERDDLHVRAPERIVVPDLMTIEKDTVGLVRFRWTAYCDGEPFVVLLVNWYMTDIMRPAEAKGKGDDFWLVEIEGRPSVRIKLEVTASLDADLPKHPQNPTEVSMLGVSIVAVQAIPQVIDADPGIMVITGPKFHWKSDLRLHHA